MGEIWLIIKREYWTRVRKKTFIIMSFLGPILIVGFIALTAYLSKGNKNNYEILVFDEGKMFDGVLRNSEKYNLKWSPDDKNYDEAQELFKKDEFRFITLSAIKSYKDKFHDSQVLVQDHSLFFCTKTSDKYY